MKENENEQKPEWPREVLIRKTLDAIAAELGDDYDEDDDSGLVKTAIIDSTRTIEIESWEQIPDGYELVHEEDRRDCEAYFESKPQEPEDDIHHAGEISTSVRLDGTIGANELKHGKLYECTIDGDLGQERCTFLQLAVDATSKRRFLLMGQRHLFADNPHYVRKLVNMTFHELESEDFDGNPERISGLQVWECLLEDGFLKTKDFNGYLYSFAEIATIKPD